ncbi:MAG: hypothetical protein HQK91_14920 [Nitrospirae bacterium]|nr:hypothetical protein [Nitrospirota bacterium]
MSFFMYRAEERLKSNRFVSLRTMIDWNKIGKHLKGIHKNDITPENSGQKPYDPLKMLKVILLKE